MQGTVWLEVKGRGLSCGHTTSAGITAVRRPRFDHGEVATMHREGDKKEIFFWRVFHGVRSKR
jgi:hypothetical protein